MFSYTYKKQTYIFYASRLSFKNAFKNVQYFCCEKNIFNPLYVKERQHTAVVDLTLPEETLFETIKPKERYKIRRAQKDGFEIMFENNIDNFIEMYEELKRHRDMDDIEKEELLQFPGHQITKIMYKGENLVMHFLIPDFESGTVLLLHSVSTRFRKEYSNQLAGRANRLLQWHDYLYFKGLGMKEYDYGGYAINSTDEQIKGINDYKLSMGGKIKNLYAYMSLIRFWGQV